LKKTFHFNSADETADLAKRLSEVLEKGDCILLSGPVGAGKTHFARAAIQHQLQKIDALEDVPSPTFTLVQSYDVGHAEIWHADLYRLSGETEIDELGLQAAFEDEICFVEWPNQLGSNTPKHALSVTIAIVGEDARNVLCWSNRWPQMYRGDLMIEFQRLMGRQF